MTQKQSKIAKISPSFWLLPPSTVKPSDTVHKRVIFLVNNMSDLNIVQVSKELSGIVPQNCENWLGVFLVSRCRIETNLIELYSSFINAYGEYSAGFGHMVIELVKKEIDTILKNCTIDMRAMHQLRNLGNFIGLLTLARDIHVCIDLKGLLRDSYQEYRDSLEYILPFICHILRGLKTGKVITKFHPWSQEILAIVKELYDLTDKMNIQFEIELLFNYLNSALADIRSAFYLRHNPKHRHPCNVHCA